jgi:phosphatidylglycerol:prolipoprotein diacylglycerol transferase
MGLTLTAVYDLTLLMAAGILIGGRFVEVAFYEWSFYAAHPHLIGAFWLGGMATHGLLLGGVIAVWVFSRADRVPFLVLTDALAVPAAFILGVGRIGNLIDGQILAAKRVCGGP